jgi:hypothetical protein
VHEFDADEKVSQNIRYFFPTGCQGIDFELEFPEVTTTRRPSTTPRPASTIPPIPIVPNDIEQDVAENRSPIRNVTSPNRIPVASKPSRGPVRVKAVPSPKPTPITIQKKDTAVPAPCQKVTHLRFPEPSRQSDCCNLEEFASLVVPIPLGKFTQNDVNAVSQLYGNDLLLKVLEIFKRN